MHLFIMQKRQDVIHAHGLLAGTMVHHLCRCLEYTLHAGSRERKNCISSSTRPDSPPAVLALHSHLLPSPVLSPRARSLSHVGRPIPATTGAEGKGLGEVVDGVKE